MDILWNNFQRKKQTTEDSTFRLIEATINNHVMSALVTKHTHATILLEAGVSEIYIAKRLGHVDTKELSRTYGHITKKIQTDELAKFTAYTSQNKHVK